MAIARGRSPRLRDLARVVIRNPDLWEVVRGNTRLAGLKSLVRDVSPKLAERVRAVREHRSNGAQPAGMIPPPEWLADLYGISRTTFSPGKAREVLGWTPRIDLDSGLASSREWLAQVGLLDKSHEP
jgi:nucleoside-diphosphate-sugar epimerase